MTRTIPLTYVQCLYTKRFCIIMQLGLAVHQHNIQVSIVPLLFVSALIRAIGAYTGGAMGKADNCDDAKTSLDVDWPEFHFDQFTCQEETSWQTSVMAIDTNYYWQKLATSEKRSYSVAVGHATVLRNTESRYQKGWRQRETLFFIQMCSLVEIVQQNDDNRALNV